MNLSGIINNVIFSIQLPVLISHIVAGFIALMAALTTGAAACLIGPQHLKRRHMGKFHLRCWQAQTFATIWVGLSALFLALAQEPTSYFLFIIGLFTLYMSFSGYLALIGRRRGALSLFLTIFIIVVGVAMLSFGIFNLQQGDFVAATPILFGVVAVLYGIGDSIQTRSSKNKSDSYTNSYANNRRFLARTLGALIAIITAFLVINIDAGQFQWIVWVGPTVVLTPIIAYLISIHRRTATEPNPKMRIALHIRHLFEAVS